MEFIDPTNLLACCGSSAWVRRMTGAQPFASVAAIHAAADVAFAAMSADDWKEAFAAHPRIGEQTSDKWARQEQSGVDSDRVTLDRLAELNLVYAAKFGYIYIVCATGKSAGEMLAILEARIGNDPETELRIAACEQAKITHLRLNKLLEL